MELIITELPKTESFISEPIVANKIIGPTLCLNMIVKNESKILPRMFDAVSDIIDCYCICDTGSTDNTIELISEYFLAKGIPGKIVQEPFKNFSHNRNVALWACKGMSDYVLLLDADMILKVSDKFDKKVLTQDYYHIFQGNEAFYYQNVRIVRNNGLYAYVGVTHEYVNIPARSVGGKVFDKKIIFVHDIGDGGAKSDKFKRDITLLEKGLEDEPNNTRYYFYLGNSYRDFGDLDNAIKTYLTQLTLNSWAQEKYCACISIGDIYKKKGETVNATKYWLKASEYDNERIEGVLKAAEHYRLTGENVVVNLLYNKYQGYKRNMAEGKLFVEQDKYWDCLEYQNSISAYYANDKESGYACCKQILLNSLMPPALLQSTLTNLRFYKDLLLKDSKEAREKLLIKIESLLDKLKIKKSDDEIWCLMQKDNLNTNLDNDLITNSIDKITVTEDKNISISISINLNETYKQIKQFRIDGKQLQAMELYTKINKDDPAYLLHEWQLEYEYSVIAYYQGIKNINTQVITILNKCADAAIIASLFSNMKFYHDILPVENVYDFSLDLKHNINGIEYTFHSSSSCIIPNKKNTGYLLNVRFVNYRIDDAGCYHDCTPHIITLNKCIELSPYFQVIKETLLTTDYVDRKYMGIEDVRIFQETNGDIQFIGAGYHQNNTIGIVKGLYARYDRRHQEYISEQTLNAIEVKPAFNPDATCEKNWVYVTYKGETHVIYSWFPLKICKYNSINSNSINSNSVDNSINDSINDNKDSLLDIVEEKPMPAIFKHVRGSTCGFIYRNKLKETNELWFVVHLVSYESPRHYYHMLVQFDEELSLKRYSAPFKFEGENIEYCLGLVVEKDRVIMTYSTWDRTTKIGVYDKKYMEKLLV